MDQGVELLDLIFFRFEILRSSCCPLLEEIFSRMKNEKRFIKWLIIQSARWLVCGWE